jgi:CheY-like chemotaxis protein
MPTAPIARVLVVDDFPQVRQLFGRFLTLAGMEPSFAADGVEGLKAARASRPDLVVCDLEMPRMDGIALCAALRADAATRRLPIVAVTGSGEEAARAAMAAGCDAVLPKPCSPALLLATIRDLLARPEVTRAVAATRPLR